MLKDKFASSVFHSCNAKDANLRHRSAMCGCRLEHLWCNWLYQHLGYGSALAVWYNLSLALKLEMTLITSLFIP
jgi:hypothetical protein